MVKTLIAKKDIFFWFFSSLAVILLITLAAVFLKSSMVSSSLKKTSIQKITVTPSQGNDSIMQIFEGNNSQEGSSTSTGSADPFQTQCQTTPNGKGSISINSNTVCIRDNTK